VTRRPLAVVALPQGPRDPVASTPPRPPGSVRRTTTIDQRRGEPGQPQEVVACGRDLRTLADGTSGVVDQVSLHAVVDGLGTVTAIESDPPEPRLGALVGGHVSKGLRARVDELLPDHADAATVLHQLLDDLPMATLISGYGAAREREDWVLPPQAAERMTDLCAGWADGATMLAVLERSDIFPIPIGPPAPDLQPADDPLAWHALPPMAPRSVRRRRRLDLVAGEPLVLDVHFRDSHLGADGLEDVLHEYALAATLDPGILTVRAATPTAHVLPWPECPGALASAARIVGAPVRTLRQTVATDFRGTATCTHLNDVLRSVAGVSALAAALP
jgi:hypothetical protein